MARQTIDIPAGDYMGVIGSGDNAIKSWGSLTARPQIIAALSPTNQTRYFSQLSIGVSGRITLSIASVVSGADPAGEDLSSNFETNGVLQIRTSVGVLTVELAGADLTEPYSWTPANSADVMAFYTALPDMADAQAATFIIADQPLLPTMAYNDGVVAEWSYSDSMHGSLEIIAAAYDDVVLQ